MEEQAASSTPRKRYCGLGNHYLRPPHKTINDRRLLSFAKHLNTELQINTTLLCGKCYDTLEKIYRVKLRHAIELKKSKKGMTANTSSISDISLTQQQTSQTSTIVSAYSTTSSTSTDKRNREVQPQSTSDDDEPLLSLNAVNGTRLPNVQPIPKRRQFVHLNKDVMDIYLSGTTGG